MLKLTAKLFSGASHIFNGTLATALISLAQNQAIVAASAVTDLTDNGGGTADGDIEAPVAIANYVTAGVDAAQKAELEAAFGSVRSALIEVVTQLNNVRAVVPAFPVLVNSLDGLSLGDGTVGAIDVSMTAVNASMTSAAGARAVQATLYDRIYQAAHFVNLLAKATGLAEIALPEGVTPNYSTTFAAVDVSTGAAVSGAQATDALGTVSKTNADAMLVGLANAVKELTAKLNAITSGTPTISVIAA